MVENMTSLYKTHAGRINQALGLIMAGSLSFTPADDAEGAEKRSYTRASHTAFESQYSDALLGSDKYEKPVWNLHDTLKLPKWLSLSLEHRTRYESLDGTFRANSRGGDQQIALQTDVWLEARYNAFRVGTEFLDARALDADSGSWVNNTHANTADFVQAYVAWSDQNLFYSGLGTEVIAGRQTLNFGSRRLVARNAFRNTINSFTGVRVRVLDYENWQFNAFFTQPVLRLPTSATDILDDRQQFDQEDPRTFFSGGFLEFFNIGYGINSEIYLYHLDEGDSPRNQSRNRRYFTPGTRFYRKPAKAAADFEFEVIGQFGTVRSSTAVNNGRDLEHAAWSEHFDAGYTFDLAWSPRIAFQYDYASGDQNPNDGQDQRFDPLFGARRFEFGPTGIYGVFARSNISTPGIKIEFSPLPDVKAFVNHRAFWLAEATDQFTTAGLQDRTGRLGSYLGQQLELNARWDYNSSLGFEAGYAHLFKGKFIEQASTAPNPRDVNYFYVQSQLRF